MSHPEGDGRLGYAGSSTFTYVCAAVEAAAVEAKGGGCGLTKEGSLEDECRGGADKEDGNKALIPRPGNLR